MGVSRLSQPASFSQNSNRLVPLNTNVPFEYLVIAGGGSSSWNGGGGGGAGGYRCSVAGELTGGGGSAEVNTRSLFGSYTVTVGAGGSASITNPRGSNSSFGDIVSIGGGGGVGTTFNWDTAGNSYGGSGGGGGGTQGQSRQVAGQRVNFPIQGNSGGSPLNFNNNNQQGAGGGGAGEIGPNSIQTTNSRAARGGNGLSSSITLTAVTRAGGGGAGSGGGNYALGGNGGSGGGGNGGGRGGGADGGTSGAFFDPGSGAVNTGSGAGGAGDRSHTANGGSGVVIIRYAASNPDLTVGAGIVIDNGSGGNVSGAGAPLTPSFSNATWKVYMFKSGTGTVTL